MDTRWYIWYNFEAWKKGQIRWYFCRCRVADSNSMAIKCYKIKINQVTQVTQVPFFEEFWPLNGQLKELGWSSPLRIPSGNSVGWPFWSRRGHLFRWLGRSCCCALCRVHHCASAGGSWRGLKGSKDISVVCLCLSENRGFKAGDSHFMIFDVQNDDWPKWYLGFRGTRFSGEPISCRTQVTVWWIRSDETIWKVYRWYLNHLQEEKREGKGRGKGHGNRQSFRGIRGDNVTAAAGKWTMFGMSVCR